MNEELEVNNAQVIHSFKAKVLNCSIINRIFMGIALADYGTFDISLCVS